MCKRRGVEKDAVKDINLLHLIKGVDGKRVFFVFSSRRRHTGYWRDWSSDVCSSDLSPTAPVSRTASPPPVEAPRGMPRGAFGEAHGAVPDGTTVFDDAVPGVANLDADLLAALRQAASAAADSGIELVVDSGWRSPDYQQRLLREAVAKYGSHKEAARWVATPEASAHVSGDAVDIGPAAATAWLSEHGT